MREEQLTKALIFLAECIDQLEYPYVKDNPRVIKRVDALKKILTQERKTNEH